MRTEMATMRRDLVDALAVIAGATKKTAQVLDNVTSQTGGDAISVAAQAA